MSSTEPFPRDDEPQASQSRKCRDIPCIVFFGLWVAAMAFLTYWAVAQEQADTDRLTHAVDYEGNICGKSAAVIDKKFLYVCGRSEAGFAGQYPKRLDFKSKTCVSQCPIDNSTAIECIGKPLVYPRERDCVKEGCVVNGVQIRKSVTWEITQSVSYQTSYPSEPYRGEICVPLWDAPNGLRDSLIAGPHSTTTQMAEAFGSIRHALPVLGIVFLIATILSLGFLALMSKYAGPVILLSLGLTGLLLGFIGVFFTIGIFFSPFDDQSGYYQWNPVYRSVYGESARATTFFLGLLLIGVCALMFRAAKLAVDLHRIDDAVGMIHACMEFVFPYDRSGLLFLVAVPFGSAAVICVVLGALIYCFMLVMSAGAVESRGIWINSDHYPSLQKSITKPLSGPLWDLAITIFAMGMIWIAEVLVGISQFVVSYCVCRWFYTEITFQENKDERSQPFIKAYQKYGTKVEGVRVHGVDAVLGGRRTGYIEEDNERGRGKVLVVPIGQKMPDGRDFIPEVAHIEVKSKDDCTWICKGTTYACGPSIGSLIWLSWPVFLSRPLRMIGEILKFLLAPTSTLVERKPYDEEDDKTLKGLMVALAGLISGFINHYFGGFSRDAYVDIILRGCNAREAAADVQDFVLKAGGVVSFMHGMTRIYEIIAVFFVCSISSIAGFWIMTSVTAFRDPNASLYVEDPMAMTFLSVLVSLLVAFNWMSLFNNTADTLLYVFSWTRKQQAYDPEFKTISPLDHEKCKEMNRTPYCPGALLSIVGAELEEAAGEALKASTQSQMTRFNHAHKQFAGSAYQYMTQGKGSALFADGERESLLKKTSMGTSVTSR